MSKEFHEKALNYHRGRKPGKLYVSSHKSIHTHQGLSLAYTPGVAAPVREILKNQDTINEYTIKGNLVAVITDGSAVLGLGNTGPFAAKPVMEGKAVLFKRFADINSIDIEIDSYDPDEIIKSIKSIAGSFGGINLEDIAAPDCFVIEEKLKEILDQQQQVESRMNNTFGRNMDIAFQGIQRNYQSNLAKNREALGVRPSYGAPVFMPPKDRAGQNWANIQMALQIAGTAAGAAAAFKHTA